MEPNPIADDERTPPRFRRWSGAGILAVVLAGTWWMLGARTDAPAAPGAPKVPVNTERVEVEDVPHLTSAIGTVTSLHSVTLRSQVDGILTAVHFKEGQTVRKGDLLARIDDRAITAAVAQAQAQKARNQAQLRAARVDLTRFENLLREEAISRQAIDQQKAQVEQLQATITANDATVAAEQVRLSFTRIVAPVTGRVGLRRVDPGNVVRASDTEGLVTVTQMDPIAVVFTLPQDLLPKLAPLLRVEGGAPVTALDRDDGTAMAQGRLAMIDNQVDSNTGTIRLKAEFANADGRLWPGQFVSVRLQTGLSARAAVVSARAVQRGLEGTFVYRVRAGKAEAVPVTVAHESVGRAVISQGLAPGDEVVTDGHSRLKAGAAVKVLQATPPAKAPAGSEGALRESPPRLSPGSAPGDPTPRPAAPQRLSAPQKKTKTG